MNTLNIAKMKIQDIKPAHYNPRDISDHEYEKLKRSIQEFGYVEPIIWNKRNRNIVGGHQRYKVLVDLGVEEIEVNVVDLDEDQEKILNLALNKISGEWNTTLLKDLLEELDTGKFDLSLTGFDYDEIENLMTAFLKEEPKIQEERFDKHEEAQKIETPITKKGDIWKLRDHWLLCGDSADLEEVERVMDGKKAHLCFCSPPSPDKVSQETDLDQDEQYVRWFIPIAQNIQKVVKENGSFFLKMKDPIQKRERSLVSFELVIALRKGLGWNYIDQLIWRKPSGPGAADKRFSNGFDPIHFFAKDPDGVEVYLYHSDHSEEELKVKRMMVDNFETIYHFAQHPTKFKFFPKRLKKGTAIPTNVIELNSQQLTKLVEWFLQVFTSRKDLVFDPFLDSGHTLLACEEKDRICVGIEQSPTYCDVIVKRFIDYVKSEEQIFLLRDGKLYSYSAVKQ